jgi:hypothetical protein
LIADEGVPGRLSFDLYLLRSNRQQREAERNVGKRGSDRSVGCDRAADRERSSALRSARPSGLASLGDATPPGAGLDGPSPARRSTARVALVVVAATRRGSIIDVLA